MNIYDLRRNIMVYSFNTHSGGGYIAYMNNGRSDGIILSKIELRKELELISSIDEEMTNEEFADYNMSQWDALNIAIRHELMLEAEKEIDSSDIGKSINKITNE